MRDPFLGRKHRFRHPALRYAAMLQQQQLKLILQQLILVTDHSLPERWISILEGIFSIPGVDQLAPREDERSNNTKISRRFLALSGLDSVSLPRIRWLCQLVQAKVLKQCRELSSKGLYLEATSTLSAYVTNEWFKRPPASILTVSCFALYYLFTYYCNASLSFRCLTPFSNVTTYCYNELHFMTSKQCYYYYLGWGRDVLF